LLLLILYLFRPDVHHPEKGEYHQACSDIATLSTAVTLFKLYNYKFPDNEEGLKALVKNPDPKKYSDYRQLLKKVPIDPWGHPYYYATTKEGFELLSFGSDGKHGGDGEARDISIDNCFRRKSGTSTF